MGNCNISLSLVCHINKMCLNIFNTIKGSTFRGIPPSSAANQKQKANQEVRIAILPVDQLLKEDNTTLSGVWEQKRL